MTLNETLDKLEQLAEKASKDWTFVAEHKGSTWPGDYSVRSSVLTHGMDGEEGVYAYAPEDVEFLDKVNPATILRLIKAMREMRGALEDAEEELLNQHSNMAHYYENRCIPTEDEFIQSFNAHQRAKAALAAADAAIAEVEK